MTAVLACNYLLQLEVIIKSYGYLIIKVISYMKSVEWT